MFLSGYVETSTAIEINTGAHVTWNLIHEALRMPKNPEFRFTSAWFIMSIGLNTSQSCSCELREKTCLCYHRIWVIFFYDCCISKSTCEQHVWLHSQEHIWHFETKAINSLLTSHSLLRKGGQFSSHRCNVCWRRWFFLSGIVTKISSYPNSSWYWVYSEPI